MKDFRLELIAAAQLSESGLVWLCTKLDPRSAKDGFDATAGMVCVSSQVQVCPRPRYTLSSKDQLGPTEYTSGLAQRGEPSTALSATVPALQDSGPSDLRSYLPDLSRDLGTMAGGTPSWAQQLFAWLLSKISPAVHEYANPWASEAFAQVLQGPVKDVVEVGEALQPRLLDLRSAARLRSCTEG